MSHKLKIMCKSISIYKKPKNMLAYIVANIKAIAIENGQYREWEYNF